MATIAAARSIFRSASAARSAAPKFASAAKPARSAFRAPTSNSLSSRIFRCPAELSVCLETMQPFHTATASALMTSMLSISPRSFGWVPDGESCMQQELGLRATINRFAIGTWLVSNPHSRAPRCHFLHLDLSAISRLDEETEGTMDVYNLSHFQL